MKLLDNSKITSYNYFYLFCIIIYAGYATVFARSLGDIRTVGNAFGLIISLIFVRKNHINFSSNYFVAIMVFLLYAVITSINNRIINPLWASNWIIWITIAYIICSGYKEKLFIVYETILYHLSVIAIIIWIFHCLFPELLGQIVDVIEFSKPFSAESNVAGNIIVYTMGTVDASTNEFTFIQRNAGFAWEPGAFACYICLAIFCTSLRSDFRIKKNKPLIVFIIALFSTQSTTGIIIFLCMLLLWLVINRKFGLAIILIPISIYIFKLPFVQDKLLHEYSRIEVTSLAHIDDTKTYTLGRMYSFILDWEEFLRHPILGLGGYAEGTWLHRMGYDNVATISGIGKLLSRFGAIMTVVFFILLYKAMRKIAETIHKNGYILIIVIVGMMISYNLWSHPIFISFWMYSVFYISSPKQHLISSNKVSMSV